jgi:hypothetical protein
MPPGEFDVPGPGVGPARNAAATSGATAGRGLLGRALVVGSTTITIGRPLRGALRG